MKVIRHPAIRFLITGITLSACLFIVLEAYYQLIYNYASLLPPFIRLYDQRYLDDDGTPRLPPSTDGWHRSYDGRPDVLIRTNSHGFRGDEPGAKRGARVALLGDSVLFNGGVELHETFPVLLEEAHKKIELLNLGVGDTNMRQHYLKLVNHAVELQPDLVIVFVYLNDAVESYLSTHRPNKSSTPLDESLAYTQLRKFFRDLRVLYEAQSSNRWEWAELYQRGDYLRDENEWRRLLYEARFDWGSGWDEGSWRLIASWGEKMREVARKHGSPLWFVIMPATPQVMMDREVKELFHPQELAKKYLGSDVIDPLPYLRAQGDREGLSYDQCHLTAKGNRIMADYLSPILQEWMNSRP